MLWPRLFVLIGCCVLTHVYARGMHMQNIAKNKTGYTLAAGPQVTGVALCYQVREGQDGWPEDVLKAFRETPWLDAASIRMRWADLEPQDQHFNWKPIESLLEEVRRHNAAHPENQRTVQIRVMAGVHSPKWFEQAGVKFYNTTRINPGASKAVTLRPPMPYDNPEFLKQLHEVYRAMYERYKDDPLVVMYHGTWSAGPWDEIFLPKDGPMPPNYTPEKFIQGMIEQLNVILEEISLKGKPAELPYSGDIPKDVADVREHLSKRIVERLGRCSPYFYAQSNGWGGIEKWIARPIEGKDVWDVNFGYQALGVNNANWGVLKQGNWIPLVQVAQRNQIPYVEIYPEDLIKLDVEHQIVEAFTWEPGQIAASHPAASAPAIPKDFIGYRPWLKQRNIVMHVRDGLLRQDFICEGKPQIIEGIAIKDNTPQSTRITYRIRTRLTGGEWSTWKDAAEVKQLPAANEAQLEAALHTDDAWFMPVVKTLALSSQGAWTAQDEHKG